MHIDASSPDDRRPLRWTLVTAIGWLVGLVLVILLSMAWERVGGGVQFMVGVGMGGGVGLLQSWVIEWGVARWHWFLASTIGMGVPYLLWDVGVKVGVNPLHAMWLCTVAGGLLVGILQARLLRAHTPRSGLWVTACVVGWSIPELLLGLDDAGFLSGRWEYLSIAGVLLGGVLLGSVTSVALPRGLSSPVGSQA